MDGVGTRYVEINGRHAITITNFSVSKTTPTKVHKGAFGPFMVSQGIPDVTGSFKVSIPRTGLEFDFEAELHGGRMSVKSPFGTYAKGFRSVYLSKQDETTDQGAGTTEITFGFTAMNDIRL